MTINIINFLTEVENGEKYRSFFLLKINSTIKAECIKKNKGNFTNFPKTKKLFFPKPEQKPECAKGDSDKKPNILVIPTDATGSPNT